jgi:hypothetical protein
MNLLAKISGWAMFGLQLFQQVSANVPHGASAWIGTAASLMAAVGIHAASSTGGTTPAN